MEQTHLRADAAKLNTSNDKALIKTNDNENKESTSLVWFDPNTG